MVNTVAAKPNCVLLHVCRHRFCNHSVRWRRYTVRWFSGEAVEPAVQRNISPVSYNHWYCAGVNADAACSLRERAICWHQCRLRSTKQVCCQYYQILLLHDNPIILVFSILNAVMNFCRSNFHRLQTKA